MTTKGDFITHAPTWIGYHLYYHQDLNRVALQFVRPLTERLLAESWIDNFFFIRYRLGGPHIRLRLQTRTIGAEAVAAVTESAARRFLADQPSTSPLSLNEVRRLHKIVLASDPHEHDDSIYPDNSLLAVPFRPEIERYGGPELMEGSLDFFTVSSATALELLGLYSEQARTRLLAAAFQALACQALSFARDAEDLKVLAQYGVDLWGKAAPHAIAKAERVFGEQRGSFERIFRQEMEREKTAAFAPSGALTEVLVRLGDAARLLSRALRGVGLATHQRIGVSQLHMTGNRLGLKNTEEVYLSRILTLTAAACT